MLHNQMEEVQHNRREEVLHSQMEEVQHSQMEQVGDSQVEEVSKSEIGPENKVSIPRMKLDGAVLAKRLREFILETLNLRFANVYDVSDWPIKKTVRTDKLEGELVSKSNFLQQLIDEPYARPIDKAKKLRSTNSHSVPEENCLNYLLNRHNDVEKLHRIIAYVLRWSNLNNLKRTKNWYHTAEAVREAKIVWIKYVQLLLKKSLEDSVAVAEGKRKISGPFKKMSPFQDELGVWRIGSRMREFTPFTEDHKPAILLP